MWLGFQVDDLAKAFSAVDQALKVAETGLDAVQSLPSADRMPREVSTSLLPIPPVCLFSQDEVGYQIVTGFCFNAQREIFLAFEVPFGDPLLLPLAWWEGKACQAATSISKFQYLTSFSSVLLNFTSLRLQNAVGLLLWTVSAALVVSKVIFA